MNLEEKIEEIENEAIELVAVDGIDTVEARKSFTARLKGIGVDPQENELWRDWEQFWAGSAPGA